MTKDIKDFRLIRAVRESLGFTQEELALLLDTSLNTISNWERGKTIPKRKDFRNIINRLYINPEWVENSHAQMFLGTIEQIRTILRDKIKSAGVQERKSYIGLSGPLDPIIMQDELRPRQPYEPSLASSSPEIKVWGTTGAGNRFNHNMQENDPENLKPIETITLNKLISLKYRDSFKVKGDSMEPGILDDAYIGVNFEDKYLRTGKLFVFNYPHEGLVVKAVQVKKDTVKIYSYNDRYEPEEYTSVELDENIIMGRVVWVYNDTDG